MIVGPKNQFKCFESISKQMMASFESKAARINNKFNGRNLNLWKFKMEMLLASMDLWDIVERFEEASPSNANSKVLKDNKICVRMAMSITGFNLADNHLRTSRVAKNLQRCGKPSITYMRQKVCPTFNSFTASFLSGRCRGWRFVGPC